MLSLVRRLLLMLSLVRHIVRYVVRLPYWIALNCLYALPLFPIRKSSSFIHCTTIFIYSLYNNMLIYCTEFELTCCALCTPRPVLDRDPRSKFDLLGRREKSPRVLITRSLFWVKRVGTTKSRGKENLGVHLSSVESHKIFILAKIRPSNPKSYMFTNKLTNTCYLFFAPGWKIGWEMLAWTKES